MLCFTQDDSSFFFLNVSAVQTPLQAVMCPVYPPLPPLGKGLFQDTSITWSFWWLLPTRTSQCQLLGWISIFKTLGPDPVSLACLNEIFLLWFSSEWQQTVYLTKSLVVLSVPHPHAIARELLYQLQPSVWGCLTWEVQRDLALKRIRSESCLR